MKYRSSSPRSVKLLQNGFSVWRTAARGAALLGCLQASAATRYWDGTSTDWSAASSWSTALDAASPNPASAPGNGDDAFFSISSLTNTALVAHLNANQAVKGITFLGTNAGSTSLIGGGTDRTLTVNNRGIAVESGAGAVSIGSADPGQGVALVLGGAQTWSNNASNALTIANGVNNGGNLLTLSGSGNIVLSGPMAGSGGLTRTGTGSAVLAGANSYGGLTTISAGVLRVAHSAALGSAAAGVVVSATGAALELDGSAGALAIESEALTLNGSGVGSASGTGGALRNVAGSNRYTGPITLSINSRISSDSGTLTLGSIAGANRTLTIAGAGDVAIEGILGIGSGGVTKLGSGTLVLSGVNAYTGATSLSEGTLRATTSASALGAGSVALSGGTLELAADSGLNFGRNTAVSGAAQVNSDRSSRGAGVTHLLGTLSIGAQTLTIGSGANVASGVAGITFGATSLSANGALFSANSGTLLTLGAVSPSGAVSRSFAVSGAGDTAIEGSIATGLGNLTKSGEGTLKLSGVNTYAGVTTLEGGVLSVATIENGGVAGNLGAASNAASKLIFSGGTLQYTGASAATDRNFTLSDGTSSTLEVSSNALTLNGASAATSGALRKSGAGTLVLAAINGHTGQTEVLAGTLRYGVDNALAAGAVSVNGGLLDLGSFADSVGAVTLTSGTIAGSGGVLTGTSFAMNGTGLASAALSGAAELIKSGVGSTTTLSGANSYTGLTAISAGVLRAAHSTALGTVANGVLVASGAALELDGAGGALAIGAEALTLQGDGISSGGALRNISGNNRYAGAITLGSAARINSDAGTLTINSAGSIGGNFGLTLGGAGDIALEDPFAPEAAGQSLTKDGDGVLTLTAPSSYSGPTYLQGGVLAFSAAEQLGQGSSIVFQNGGGRLRSSSDGITLSQAISQSSAAQYEVPDAQTLVLSGLISGAGKLQKYGEGTLVLENSGNHFTGTPEIYAGTLKLGQGALSAVTDFAIKGGSFDLNGNTQNVNGALVLGSAALGTPGTISGGGKISVGGSVSLVSGAISSVLDGAAPVTKTGSGSVSLSGNNTFSGPVSLIEGVLDLLNGGGLGSAEGGTEVDEGAALQLSGGLEVERERLSLNGGGINLGGALRSLGGSNRWSGAVELKGPTRVTVDDGSLTLGGDLQGDFPLIVGGIGRLKLVGASNGTSAMVVEDGATVQVGDGGIRGLLGSGDVTLGSGSNLEFNWLSGTLNAVGNAIRGAGSVRATGGVISLSAAQTYTGATAISAGTLEVAGNGQLSGTDRVIIAGGTLLLSGSAGDRVNDAAEVILGGISGGISKLEISGSVSETFGPLILSGGGIRVIDFGSGSGVLTFGSLSSSAPGNSLHIWNWTGQLLTGGGTDQLRITSGVLGANLTLADITIFGDSGITPAGTGEVVWTSDGELVALVAVPEPSSVLAGLLILGLSAWRERHQWARVPGARRRKQP